MSYDPRTCVNCLEPFVPKRKDMMFCNPRCTDALYIKEEAAYVQFAIALVDQRMLCYFCFKHTTEVRLRTLFLYPPDETSIVVAACQPCKWDYYLSAKWINLRTAVTLQH